MARRQFSKGRLTSPTSAVAEMREGMRLPRLLAVKQPMPKPRKQTMSERFWKKAKILTSVPSQRMRTISRYSAAVLTRKRRHEEGGLMRAVVEDSGAVCVAILSILWGFCSSA